MYNGIATEVGTFSPTEIERFFDVKINYPVSQGKIFDIVQEDREILIYAEPMGCKVICINRYPDKHYKKNIQELARISWVMCNTDNFSRKVGW